MQIRLRRDLLAAQRRSELAEVERRYAAGLAELQAECPHNAAWVGEDYDLAGRPCMKCWACDKVLK